MEYRKLEWVGSTGTQYIDTGVFASPHYCAEVSFMVSQNTTNWDTIFGARNGTYSRFTCRFMNSVDGCIGIHYSASGTGKTEYYDSAYPKSLYMDSFHTVRLEKNIACIDNRVVHTFTGPADRVNYPYSLYLFANNDGGIPGDFGNIQLQYCKIWDDTTLVRDFIPVLDENGVACLYDQVSETFFYNQGTGNFYWKNTWKIQHETLEAYADQARRLGGVSGKLTTAQMLDIFSRVPTPA